MEDVRSAAAMPAAASLSSAAATDPAVSPSPAAAADPAAAFAQFARDALTGYTDGDPIARLFSPTTGESATPSVPATAPATSATRELWGATYVVDHDEREAPFVADDAILMTRSDENGLVAEVFARPRPDSGLVGIGLDLCSNDDFAGEVGQKFARLIFFPQELALLRVDDASTLDDAGAHDGAGAYDELALSRLFAAKEAAFKSAAAALRAHYARNGEKIFFEVRDMCQEQPGVVVGASRVGDARRGLELLGIRRIEVRFMQLDGMQVALALALAA